LYRAPKEDGAAPKGGRMTIGLRLPISGFAWLAAALVAGPLAGHAQPATGESFVEDFDKLDTNRWQVSDGWSNGEHQNCTWSKGETSVEDGKLKLGFRKEKTKDRDYACGEVQTRQRFGYGTFEVRMKAAAGSGLNSAFFTYIGPVHKQPHDEIDFEVLGKDVSKVQINRYVDGKSRGPGDLVDVAGGADKDFHDYAFIWQKDRIAWYVDGKLAGEASDLAKLPSHPSKIYLSIWGSDTLTSWMGAFADPGQPVAAEVERVAYTAEGDACQFPESIVCKTQSQ
jgi:endo-1,3-1,4-beta-glycanase ExoK